MPAPCLRCSGGNLHDDIHELRQRRKFSAAQGLLLRRQSGFAGGRWDSLVRFGGVREDQHSIHVCPSSILHLNAQLNTAGVARSDWMVIHSTDSVSREISTCKEAVPDAVFW